MPSEDDEDTPVPTIDDGREDQNRIFRAESEMKDALIREQRKEVLILTSELNERKIENEKLKLALRESRERVRELISQKRK